MLAGVVLLFTAASARAEQGSTSRHCPAYTEHLEQARASLVAGERERALGELRLAKDAISACIRFEAELQGMPTMLASVIPAEESATELQRYRDEHSLSVPL